MRESTPLARRSVLRGMAAGTAGLTAGVATGAARTGETAGWEEILARLTGDCAIRGWPEATPDRINLSGPDPVESGDVPDGGDLVIYIHGLGGQDAGTAFDGARQARGFELALREQQVDLPVVAGMWDSLIPPIEPERAAVVFADWLEENHAAYDNLFVFGHSLGGLVTVEALNTLVERGSDATITDAGLFGAAVPPADVCGVYREALETTVEGGVYNYHSEGDTVICELGPIGVGEAGIGCQGTDCPDPPENYLDIDLTGRVMGHCPFFMPESMEYRGESGVPAVVDQQFAPRFDLPRGTVTGTVSDADDDTPRPDTPLAFIAGETLVRTTTSDADGEYEVTLPAGTYEIRGGPGVRTDTPTVTVTDGETETVAITARILTAVADTPPRDLNRDGRFEDINGDGEFTIADVQALFDNLDASAIQDNPEAYDFSGTGGAVTIFDVQALFNGLSE